MPVMANRPNAADQPQMSVADFEELARLARNAELGARLEFIDGKLGAKPMPDGDHDEIFQWLLDQFREQRDERSVYPEVGLKVASYRGGRARTDAVLAPKRAFAGQGEWKDPDPVLMVVEVTSFDSDTDRRDRKEKPRAYAEAGIPVYLLIDRDVCETFVYSGIVNDVYSSTVHLPFGSEVELPEPVGVILDTEPLKDLVR
ncbi:Uma2 family endonuclease [Nocardia sp. IFM 10818]